MACRIKRYIIYGGGGEVWLTRGAVASLFAGPNPVPYPQLGRRKLMTEREMFKKSFERPSNYFELSGRQRWEIDEQLGILDWAGEDLSKDDMKRFKKHYRS